MILATYTYIWLEYQLEKYSNPIFVVQSSIKMKTQSVSRVRMKSKNIIVHKYLCKSIDLLWIRPHGIITHFLDYKCRVRTTLNFEKKKTQKKNNKTRFCEISNSCANIHLRICTVTLPFFTTHNSSNPVTYIDWINSQFPPHSRLKYTLKSVLAVHK